MFVNKTRWAKIVDSLLNFFCEFVHLSPQLALLSAPSTAHSKRASLSRQYASVPLSALFF